MEKISSQKTASKKTDDKEITENGSGDAFLLISFTGKKGQIQRKRSIENGKTGMVDDNIM